MCKQNKLKIFYLNVNGFFGDSSIKEALYKKCPMYNKCCTKANDVIKACKNDQLNILYADRIFDIISDKGYDLIFLSEIYPRSAATKRFVENLGKEYKVLTPWYEHNYDDVDNDITSCTLCFAKNDEKTAKFTNEENGFTKKDYLQLCKIKNKDWIIMGIHWSKNTNDFVDSFNRLMENQSENVLVFGDTNANPDALEKQDKHAYETNKEFMKLVGKYELNEIKPTKENENYPRTYRGITRIDRVFSITSPEKEVNVEILEDFWVERLSDHAGLSITVTL